MPGLVDKKRVLQDITSSPSKKRKLNGAPNNSFKGAGSSQPKSQFEEEVLEKLTQDMNGLKRKNAEKDQHWARPSLDGIFDEKTDNLCFQQIDVEEGTLHGGKTTIKLFGVTQVITVIAKRRRCTHTSRMVIQSASMSRTSSTIYTLPRRWLSNKETANLSKPTSRHN